MTHQKNQRVLFACLLLAFVGSYAGENALGGYTALDLYTMQIPAGASLGIYVPQVAAGGQLVGYSYIDSLSPSQALLFTPGGVINLPLPSGFQTSRAYGTDGTSQVGWGGTSSSHALLWNGTGGPVVDLNPAALGALGSEAIAVRGVQQVGDASFQVSPSAVADHAILWFGTAASAVDLNPTGFSDSFGSGTDGIHQVGGGGLATSAHNHALLWSGTAASAVDLNPTSLGFTFSRAYGVSGNQQVGIASATFTGTDQAMLWTGSADSAVDLNPSGFFESHAYGTNGILQVGDGWLSSSGPIHAMLWSGNTGSVMDLNSLLPAGFTSSQAFTVDPSGNVFGIAQDSSQNWHAIEWVPEPSSTALAVFAGVLLTLRRTRPSR